MTNPLIARLRRLTDLAEADLDALMAVCTPVQGIAAGADIAPQGHGPGSLDVLVDGWAARYKILPDGRRQFPALLVPGDLCNLDGLHLRRIHSGVWALTDCKVVSIPHTRLRALVDERPDIRDAIWWLQSVENAVSTEWSVGLGRRTAIERFAHLLCELLVRLGTVGLSSEHGFSFPLTQADLADTLGLSIVHVNRMLMELRGRGLIETKGRWLKIVNHEALKVVASFNPDYLHLEGLRSSLSACVS